ncbi:nitrilase-related carbon-nitrogen hydrolase [Streptomyces fuscichromogenes]|uniref:Nitrilase n=1 Tax=Streptomyces fuscichromogenes TaxID=1324013 RepID=A0A918CTE7_9ACTN|nr:nitrilase-related carbon-nitrogen hydrolase [Streptomyces fuscichromogenes]GGN20432.1 nitrilase [Streptomyces fuscichromogenes]
MEYNERQTFKSIRVAAVQAEPVLLDIDGTTDKAVSLIEQAAAENADLIGFPEAFIPTFPNWYETLGEGAVSRDLDKELFKHSVEVPGAHIEAVADACRRGNINAVIGINERLNGSTGTMFNTQVHISRTGEILGKHQKYVPTTGERYVHGPGQTGHVNAFRTDFGAVSGLICGENSNPLGQYAAATAYPVVHVASWPSYFRPYFPMHHAIQTATAGVAYSLKTYALASVSRISEAYIDAVAATDEDRAYLTEQRALKKGALILDYHGRLLVDGSGQDAEVVFADLDLEEVLVPKLVLDFAGHYNRPEIFAPLFER